jgi:pyrimidine deaminase RibD-like protein
MRFDDFKIHSQERLDVLLADCVEELFRRRQKDPEYWGLVSAAIMDPEDTIVFGVNHMTDAGTRKHAERVAIENYEDRFGPIPDGCIIVTTLSPCSAPMSERWGQSCTAMLNNSRIKKVYAGWADPGETDTDEYRHKRFRVEVTKNPKLHLLCQKIGLLAIK